ncbi:ribonuclease Z [Haoranjiania flava]|uniref:Ribonuclease Z n=1 Tax=Haoranjiania flava TaxID=1856322 RepID=A0AAE3LNZ1_9BACT|nr:ribonuclease Z [Haoranjiania flava]MCU7695471.1 ribonuclease Z [Haoranjiania flava]
MFGVTILGNNSAIPTPTRHPTSQAVYIDDQVLLLDCGEGTQMQMHRYKIKRSKINYIFISHLHGDHYFGLIGLLNSFALIGRKDDLHLFAPEPLYGLIDLQMQLADSEFPYTIHRYPLKEEGEIAHSNTFTVKCFRVKHRIECWGFAIMQKQKLRKLNIEEVKKHLIPTAAYYSIKKGEDYMTSEGNIIPNKLLTIDPPKGKVYAYCADTLFTDSFLHHIADADMIYHESTYLKDMEEKAFKRFHSTAEQAATIARRANAKRLLIGHFSSKYEFLEPFESEARQVFENTEIAREGVTYLLK